MKALALCVCLQMTYMTAIALASGPYTPPRIEMPRDSAKAKEKKAKKEKETKKDKETNKEKEERRKMDEEKTQDKEQAGKEAKQ